MTEYEMASLANDYRDSMGAAAAMAFTTVSAFLVAGYLTAHKLNRFMTATVVTVYTLWLAGAVTNIVFIAINTDGLRRQMHLMAEQGQGLQWHLASSYSQSYVAAAVGVTLVVFAIIYLASVVFFFQSARQSREAEAQS